MGKDSEDDDSKFPEADKGDGPVVTTDPKSPSKQSQEADADETGSGSEETHSPQGKSEEGVDGTPLEETRHGSYGEAGREDGISSGQQDTQIQGKQVIHSDTTSLRDNQLGVQDSEKQTEEEVGMKSPDQDIEYQQTQGTRQHATESRRSHR